MAQIGKVKWFNDKKGYGFLIADGVKENIFVHHTAIHMEGYRALFPDQDVEFELMQDKRGLKAVNVRVIDMPKKGAPANA
jgi:CspA family cold shock protein